LTPPTVTTADLAAQSEPVSPSALQDPEESGSDRSSGNRHSFPFLQDRDIHLFIVESYGHTTRTNPEHRALMAPVYQRLYETLRGGGYFVYSSFLKSPAFGGRSWLADATLLTGVFIDTQAEYDALLDSETPNLTHLLGAAGYHRILAAPGTDFADDRWKAFYEFDTYLLRRDFGYMGPWIGFGAMPDQFLIDRTWRIAQELPRDVPRFINYVLVSSHVPFDRLPAYLENWEELGDGSVFQRLPIRTFRNNWLTGGEYPAGYVAGIDYTLTSIVAFLTEHLDREALIVVVGDHQPRIPVSEYEATFSVPIHVISQDYRLVEQFASFGFSLGITPTQPLPHRPMDQFIQMLTQVALGRTWAESRLAP